MMSTADQPNILHAALAAHDAGLCVVRAATDGSKKPLGKWKQYQSERPTRDEVAAWFADGHAGMGVICGAVSGDLEMFELEGRFMETGGGAKFTAACRDAGLELLLKRLANGYHTISPSGGRHFLYRCTGAIDGNTKLARRPATDEELTEKPDDPIKTLIETRGEGGFVVLAPSHGTVHPTGKAWQVKAGTFESIPTITGDERDALFAVARSFNEGGTTPVMPPPPPAQRTTPQRWTGGNIGESWMEAVVDHVNATTPVRDLLEKYRWTYCYTDSHGRQLLRRPGKDQGVSGSINENGRLRSFSSSTPFDSDKDRQATTYDALDVLAVYEYSGDRQAAARAIAEASGILKAWQRQRDAAALADLTISTPITVREAPPGVDPSTGEINGPRTPALDDTFWNARPYLAHIHTAAKARLVAPAALLGAVLARVAAFTPPSTCIPSLVGGNVPLTIYTALRGASGAGKSSTMAAAVDLLPDVPPGCVGPLSLGSGEGLVEAFMDLVEEEGSDGKKRKVKRQVHHGGLFSLDEGQALNEMGSRKGSIIMPVLRVAWTGGDPGQANASIETRRSLKAGSYAVGLISAWQDHVAAALLSDEAGGTPQRFLWLPTDDPDATIDTPAWPGPLDWHQRPLIAGGGYIIPNPLNVADEIVHEVRQARVERLRSGVDLGLDSHRLLSKLKVASCLAVLDGRDDVNPDDWQLAEAILATSDGVRAWIVAEAKRTNEDRKLAGHRYAIEREAVVEKAAHDRALNVMARAVGNKVRRAGDCTRRDLSHATPSKYRSLVSLDEAIAEAERLQWIVVHGVGATAHFTPGKAQPA